MTGLLQKLSPVFLFFVYILLNLYLLVGSYSSLCRLTLQRSLMQ